MAASDGGKGTMADGGATGEGAKGGRTLIVERHRRALPFGRVVLVLAALTAVAAVILAVVRGRGAAPSAVPPAVADGSSAAPSGGDLGQRIAGLEEAARAAPDDAEAWRKLGWAYYGTERFQKAADAYARATAIDPGNADSWSALGEALVYTGTTDEPLKPQAIAAFRRALALAPGDPRARYFLAVDRDLKGDHKGAIDDWLALLRDTPAGAPWDASLRDTITRAGEKYHVDVAGRMPPPSPAASAATAAIPGPTREQMAAASSLPPGQQEAMIRGMVDGLAQKLRANPKDADGWLRLIRARMVLGQQAEAAQALADARGVFAGDQATLRALGEGAKALGVPGV